MTPCGLWANGATPIGLWPALLPLLLLPPLSECLSDRGEPGPSADKPALASLPLLLLAICTAAASAAGCCVVSGGPEAPSGSEGEGTCAALPAAPPSALAGNQAGVAVAAGGCGTLVPLLAAFLADTPADDLDGARKDLPDCRPAADLLRLNQELVCCRRLRPALVLSAGRGTTHAHIALLHGKYLKPSSQHVLSYAHICVHGPAAPKHPCGGQPANCLIDFCPCLSPDARHTHCITVRKSADFWGYTQPQPHTRGVRGLGLGLVVSKTHLALPAQQRFWPCRPLTGCCR